MFRFSISLFLGPPHHQPQQHPPHPPQRVRGRLRQVGDLNHQKVINNLLLTKLTPHYFINLHN